MRPNALKVLGLDAQFVFTNYAEVIRKAGGLPVMLPVADEENCVETMLRLNGLMLTGDSRDIPPEVLGQEPHPKSTSTSMKRWNSDTYWLETARSLGTPVLAICFGMQLLNVSQGGGLLQDIPDCLPAANAHITPGLDLDHVVNIETDTLLASMSPSPRPTVRSTHHQAVAEAAPGFRIVARAEDGVVEAIEHPDEAFVLGVQWHPELAPSQPDWLIEGFVRHCVPEAPH